MITLGIEGTAHSIGVGIIEDINEKCNVLSNEIKIYKSIISRISEENK